jgi:GT2 family glycosyltransferase
MQLHSQYDKIVIVGFKENIEINDPRISDAVLTSPATYRHIRPNYKNDWRYRKEVKMNWKMQQYTLREPRDFICEIYKKTRAFKDFGKGRIMGVWDLPSMVVTNNISVKTKELLEIGGFDERFFGWGLEDTFLGAKLIANGNYIVPFTKSSCYHIKHTVADHKKAEEWLRNKGIYFRLLKDDFELFKKPLPKREIRLLRCETLGKCYKNFWEVV